jgi:hypothetical protein
MRPLALTGAFNDGYSRRPLTQVGKQLNRTPNSPHPSPCLAQPSQMVNACW